MKIYKKIRNCIINTRHKLGIYFFARVKIYMNSKRLFLMGTPWHGNLGDEAIALAEKYILNKNYNDYEIIEYPLEICQNKLFQVLGLGIRKNDIIYMHGGGNLGTLYISEEKWRRNFIQYHSENKIIVMPQSIFFHNNNFGITELKESCEIYNCHKNLTFILRDEVSYNFAKKNFYNVKKILAPDAVTSLQGIMENEKINRTGLTFFLRNDKEKIVDISAIKQIKHYLKNNKINYKISDTVVPYKVYSDQRKKEVFKVLRLAKASRLIITDRYHGVIFSVITNTPVIAFKSFDTKISSGIKWFKDFKHVHYIEDNNINEIEKLIEYYCNGEEKEIVKDMNVCKEKILRVVNKIGV